MATTTKKVRSLESMRAAHETQAAGIRAHPDFQRVSDEFDVEYEVARQMQMARKQAGLTQGDLARRMHTTQSVVSRIESGVNVTIETLARFAEACGSRVQVQMVRETRAGYGRAVKSQ
jgi:ribosome-binding protein aMBF1 (putative translation factor)